MFFKKRVKGAVELDTALTDTKPQRIIRKIINGKLYDTSKALKICHVIISNKDIPEYGLLVSNLFGEDADIYKGTAEYFVEYHGIIQPVTTDWVKEVLGKHNVDKYIELFGEPELA